MDSLEAASIFLARALEDWQSAVNAEYERLKSEQDGAGENFPARSAMITVQERLKRLAQEDFTSPVQKAGLLAAWSSWAPPAPAPKPTPFIPQKIQSLC
jgi:hypothetical protein